MTIFNNLSMRAGLFFPPLFTPVRGSCIIIRMKRILTLYIIREIASLFLLGIVVFTLILLMGRLIKLTDLVISRGVPMSDISLMILYLMPSFLVFTIPMAFLLAVLLAFGRLSADNEITVMKSGGLSLVQICWPSARLSYWIRTLLRRPRAWSNSS